MNIPGLISFRMDWLDLLAVQEWGAKTGETLGVGPTVHEKEHFRDQSYLDGRASPRWAPRGCSSPGQLERETQTLDADWTRQVSAK